MSNCGIAFVDLIHWLAAQDREKKAREGYQRQNRMSFFPDMELKKEPKKEDKKDGTGTLSDNS